ncbi:MAG: HupE/UreJ family protein [Bacteroidia bacterium]|nr:HupE/UreJ family protein [Bacteroidia bacterium]
MNSFTLWFSTGMEHILDFSGYDHILFVSLLVLTFPPSDWKKVLILITAFTVGHSISLALSVINSLHLNQGLIEFLIAFSILLSATYNLVFYKNPPKRGKSFLYLIVTFFGLIHGLGFSFLLRVMLGHEENILAPLLYFNLGLELGQIVIVSVVLLFSLLTIYLFKWPYQIFKLIPVCLIVIISLKMCIERLLQLFQSS